MRHLKPVFMTLLTALSVSLVACGGEEVEVVNGPAEVEIGERELAQTYWGVCYPLWKDHSKLVFEGSCKNWSAQTLENYCYWYVCNDDLWWGLHSTECRKHCGFPNTADPTNFYGVTAGGHWCNWTGDTVHCGCRCYKK